MDLEQLRADMEAGTPGPWRIHDCTEYGDRCQTYYQEVWNEGTDILVTTEVTRAHKDGGRTNMRRIARLPDLERAYLDLRKAADELEQRMLDASLLLEAGMVDESAYAMDTALTAYREATQ